MTTDRNDPRLREHHTDGLLKGQQRDYLVLAAEERAKGFVRPVRRSYRHLACGAVTTMGIAIAETYARDPKFYGGTFCSFCGQHFRLGPPSDPAFVWEPDGEPVGSSAEEARVWRERLEQIEAEKNRGRASDAIPDWR